MLGIKAGGHGWLAGHAKMPRKVRELVRDLQNAGFVVRGGKGSHRKFKHPAGVQVTLSGNSGADAKAYQELDVARAIKESSVDGK